MPEQARRAHRGLLQEGHPHRPARARPPPDRRARRRADAVAEARRGRRARLAGRRTHPRLREPEPGLGAARSAPRAVWRRAFARNGSRRTSRPRLRCGCPRPIASASRENLRLAEQLGAETVRLSGESAAQEVILYARSRNVTKIVVGKPTHPRWRDLVRRSVPRRDRPRNAGHRHPGHHRRRTGSGGTVTGAAASPRAGAAERGAATRPRCSPSSPRRPSPGSSSDAPELADVVMVYLLGIVLVAMRFGYGPSILAAVLSVLSLDFFFVPPYLSFSVTDFRHVVTFAVMFVVALVISRLTKRIRDQADTARQRELRSTRLYAMSRELAGTSSVDALVRIATKHLGEAFDAEICVLLPDADGRARRRPRAERLDVRARAKRQRRHRVGVDARKDRRPRDRHSPVGERALPAASRRTRQGRGPGGQAEAPAKPDRSRAAAAPRDVREPGRDRPRTRAARRGGTRAPRSRSRPSGSGARS